jgi:serine/threonine protein kinase
VLRARHRQLKRLVAIKLLHQDLKSAESVTRFLREARAAAQIRSAHVAHVMDAGLLRNGQPYIVMEYLQGQDLASVIAARGRMPVEQAVGFTLQALDALAEAHSMQIIHRDLKPGNLFATRVIGGDTTIKVVDFGLAKTSRTLDTLDPGVTERGAVLGTPSYMSPEQFVDAQDVDARADIWGIGATLFELLTGVPPFRGTNLPQIYTAVMHKPIMPIRSAVPDLPEGLERVVASCLTREREGRYANVAELAAALAPYAGDAARERVDRIRRVIDGVLESGDHIDLPADVFLDSAPQAGVISSTFARGSDDVRATPAVSRSGRVSRRKYSIFAALAAVALIGSWLWWHGASSVEPPREQPEAARATNTEPDEHTPPPAPAAEPTHETTVAPPPATVPVAPPTANKARRAKTSKSPAPKPSNTSIYEQYP